MESSVPKGCAVLGIDREGELRVNRLSEVHLEKWPLKRSVCVCLNQSCDGKRDIIMRDAWPTERRNCTNQDRRSQNQIFRWRIRIDAVSKEKKRFIGRVFVTNR